MTRARVGLPLLAIALLSACSLRTAACGASPASRAQTVEAPPVDPANPAEPAKLRIAFLGDSLTVGYGLLTQEAYPAVIERMLHAEGYSEIETVNAGMTGDTSAGGVRRLDEILTSDVRILVVALGGNDALRGLTPTQTHDNLAAIVDAALAKRVAVLVAGMQAPTNMGQDYRNNFSAAFARLASEYKDRIVFVPFLLEGVAGNPALNQEDGIHPTVEGARLIAEALYPRLRAMIDQIG